MLDTMSTELVQAWPWMRDLDFIVGAANDVASLNRRPLTLPRESLEGLDTDEQVRRALEALRTQGAASAEFGEEHLRTLFHILRDRARSRAGYVVEPFHGTLTLFRATDLKDRTIQFFAPYSDEERRTMGWCRHVADVDVRPVPGQHITLLSEPHVRAVAAQVTEALACARAGAAARAPEVVS
jgi:polyketide synthase 13